MCPRNTPNARLQELNERAVRALVLAHAERVDEPLILAVRYQIDQAEDIYLLEILGGFPGGDDDELLPAEFEPSSQLRILGSLHLTLGSPAQLRAAIDRGDAVVDDLKRGEIVHDDGSKEAAGLKRALGLRGVTRRRGKRHA